jgi:antagonist of KipI
MTIKVIKPGLLTTVQDRGRRRFQKYGVIVGGAMDEFALRAANVLVGNDESAAALEVTMVGPTLEFQAAGVIAVCGGNLSPAVDGREVPLWRPIYVHKGAVLSFGAAVSGCRAYVAAAGGIDVPLVMGSASTYLRAGIGGLHGRALGAGDVLRCGPRAALVAANEMPNPWRSANWFISTEIIPLYEPDPMVRVMKGKQYEYFTPESKDRLFEAAFRVTPHSDRMGYRMEGPKLSLSNPREMITSAVTAGTIQIPPEGHPIVLLADRQTTGGYPVIAQVAAVDLPLVAQVKPGGYIRFTEITLEAAQELFLLRELEIRRLQQAVRLKK